MYEIMSEIYDLKKQKRQDAFHIFYESVLKPDVELRQYAHDEECYHELMDVRAEVLSYLKTKRWS